MVLQMGSISVPIWYGICMSLAFLHGQVMGKAVWDGKNSRENLCVEFKVQRGVPVGEFVGNIPTKPGFTYRFDENFEFFVLNCTSGEVRTRKKIDKEALQNDQFDLVVHSSQPSYSIEVRILIKDTNDCSQFFPEPEVSVTFPESAISGTRVILDTAGGVDFPKNGVQTGYKIVDGNEDGHFRLVVITNRSGEVPFFHLETTGKLDRGKKSNYRLNISAQDDGIPPRFGFLIVSVLINREIKMSVSGSNDYAPQFQNAIIRLEGKMPIVLDASLFNKELQIIEVTPIDSELIQFKATDSDLGKNGQITYSITRGNLHETFRINGKTGIIYLNKQLDYEKSTKYILTITATDAGCPKRSTFLDFIVKVMIINESLPIWANKEGILLIISENILLGEEIAKLTANDIESGKMSYSIIKGDEEMFMLDAQTGVLKIIDYLNRETKEEWRLVIRANDGEQYSDTQVTVMVTDTNVDPKDGANFQHLNRGEKVSNDLVTGKKTRRFRRVSRRLGASDSDDGLDEDEEETLTFWQNKYSNLNQDRVETDYTKWKAVWMSFKKSKSKSYSGRPKRTDKKSQIPATLTSFLKTKFRTTIYKNENKISCPKIKYSMENVNHYIQEYGGGKISNDKIEKDFLTFSKAWKDQPTVKWLEKHDSHGNVIKKTETRGKENQGTYVLGSAFKGKTDYKVAANANKKPKLEQTTICPMDLVGLSKDDISYWKKVLPEENEKRLKYEIKSYKKEWENLPNCKTDANNKIVKVYSNQPFNLETYINYKMSARYATKINWAKYPENSELLDPTYWLKKFPEFEEVWMKKKIDAAYDRFINAGTSPRASTQLRIMGAETRIIKGGRRTLRGYINVMFLNKVGLLKAYNPWKVSINRFPPEQRTVAAQRGIFKKAVHRRYPPKDIFKYLYYVSVGIPDTCEPVENFDFHRWLREWWRHKCEKIYYYFGSANPDEPKGFCHHMIKKDNSLYNLKHHDGGNQVLIVDIYELSDVLPMLVQNKCFKVEGLLQIIGACRTNQVEPTTDQLQWIQWNIRVEQKPTIRHFMDENGEEVEDSFDRVFAMALDPQNFQIFSQDIYLEETDKIFDGDQAIEYLLPLKARKKMAFDPFLCAEQPDPIDVEDAEDEDVEDENPQNKQDDEENVDELDENYDEVVDIDDCVEITELDSTDDDTDDPDYQEEYKENCQETTVSTGKAWSEIDPRLPALDDGIMLEIHNNVSLERKIIWYNTVDRGPYLYYNYIPVAISRKCLKLHPIRHPNEFREWMSEYGKKCKDLKYYFGSSSTKGVCKAMTKEKARPNPAGGWHQGSLHKLKKDYLVLLVRNWKASHQTEIYWSKGITMRNEGLHQIKAFYREFHSPTKDKWKIANIRVELLPTMEYFFGADVNDETYAKRFDKLYTEALDPVDNPLFYENSEVEPKPNDNRELNRNPTLFNIPFNDEDIMAVFPEDFDGEINI